MTGDSLRVLTNTLLFYTTSVPCHHMGLLSSRRLLELCPRPRPQAYSLLLVLRPKEFRRDIPTSSLLYLNFSIRGILPSFLFLPFYFGGCQEISWTEEIPDAYFPSYFLSLRVLYDAVVILSSLEYGWMSSTEK